MAAYSCNFAKQTLSLVFEAPNRNTNPLGALGSQQRAQPHSRRTKLVIFSLFFFAHSLRRGVHAGVRRNGRDIDAIVKIIGLSGPLI